MTNFPDDFPPPQCNTAPTFAFTGPTGPYVPPEYCKGTLDYSTTECADKESDYIAGLMAEALNIAAGPVNVFPLLGVHNQGSTLDQPGDGYPISSGTPAGYNLLDAFNVDTTVWQTTQSGAAVTSTPSFIGYNFGTKKAWEAIGPAQERYFPKAPVRRQISTLKIKQSANPTMRAAQVRIEASDDGVSWHRVDVINLPNTASMATAPIRSNAAFNQWRIVPTFFSGVATNSPWEVMEVHLLESNQLSLETIEDFVLLENRDRAYCQTSTMLKCTYDLLDVQTELAKFGINLPQTYIFTLSFADMVVKLGRPVIVGDIVELPGETQYDHKLRPVRKWLEVTDCGWSTEGYTMNWKPNLFRFYAQPILPSVEHKDILGLPGQVNNMQSDADFLINGLLQNQEGYESTEAFRQASLDAVPQTGSDPANIQSGMPLIGKPGQYDGNDLYAEDAIPPNGAVYTSGDALPDPTLIDVGHYHRQTYALVDQAVRPPDRLLRWNGARWKVVEVNTRGTPESHKKTMSKLLGSMTRLDVDKPL